MNDLPGSPDQATFVTERSPRPGLMARLEQTGMTPADFGFYPAARQAVVDMGIVRRRKVDVAADIPARRIADLPVELDEAESRSIRGAERELAGAFKVIGEVG